MSSCPKRPTKTKFKCWTNFVIELTRLKILMRNWHTANSELVRRFGQSEFFAVWRKRKRSLENNRNAEEQKRWQLCDDQDNMSFPMFPISAVFSANVKCHVSHFIKLVSCTLQIWNKEEQHHTISASSIPLDFKTKQKDKRNPTFLDWHWFGWRQLGEFSIRRRCDLRQAVAEHLHRKLVVSSIKQEQHCQTQKTGRDQVRLVSDFTTCRHFVRKNDSLSSSWNRSRKLEPAKWKKLTCVGKISEHAHSARSFVLQNKSGSSTLVQNTFRRDSRSLTTKGLWLLPWLAGLHLLVMRCVRKNQFLAQKFDSPKRHVDSHSQHISHPFVSNLCLPHHSLRNRPRSFRPLFNSSAPLSHRLPF